MAVDSEDGEHVSESFISPLQFILYIIILWYIVYTPHVFKDISMLLYPSALNTNLVDFALNSATCIQITSGSE